MLANKASTCHAAAGEVSFHSGWTFHQASGNKTDTPREVYTIIFMDKDMLMAEPINHNQRLDHDRSASHMCPFNFSILRLSPLDLFHLNTFKMRLSAQQLPNLHHNHQQTLVTVQGLQRMQHVHEQALC